MNNTIDFKTAKTIDSMSKKLDHIDDTVTGFFSVMHMAMKHELGSAEPYFAATSPVLDLTVIRPDDAPHILACFDEADDDREFYEAPCDQPGTVVKMKYNTNMYGEKTYKKTMYVYLPYGYDENGTDRYPVIYFFHGRGCDPTTLLCNPETKNAFDHMISTGVAKPFILVAPTYYYDARHLLYDWEQFPREMREEIMPLVESTYRT